MTQLDMLDFTLREAGDIGHPSGISVSHIKYCFEREGQSEVGYPMAKAILDKLVRDGYCVKSLDFEDTKYDVSFQDGWFEITFEGLVFLEQGGYAEQAVTASFEKNRMKRMEKIQRDQASVLVVATSVATVASLSLVVFEAVKYWHLFSVLNLLTALFLLLSCGAIGAVAILLMLELRSRIRRRFQ